MLICAAPARAAFPTNTYAKTLTFSTLRSDNAFKDFNASMTGYEDLKLTFTYDSSIAGTLGQVKIKQSGGTNVYFTAGTSDVTISTTTLSFTLSHTNAIPNGTHNVDILIISAANTNLVKCGGQEAQRARQPV